ncbi:MAG: metallophosphoesterase [Sphingobacteriaceae bacterium]
MKDPVDTLLEVFYEVILIGDSGNIARHRPDPVFELLKKHLPLNTPSAIIFLGDNVYPKGLPAQGDPLRSDAELVLNKHYDVVKDYPGKVIFLSGNHDWNRGKDDGFEYVIRQEKYLEKLFDGKNVYLPSNGCPGPKEIPVNDHLTLIAINTQWWIQRGFRPMGKADGCSVASEEEFFTELESIMERNKQKRILVLGHYPIYSYSMHGGKFTWRHHIFPLTIYKKRAMLPLPVIGSLLPLYRKYYGAKEDLAHPRFRHLRKRLKHLFRLNPNVIYAAGHEHNLQHIEKYGNHYIVSGAASKSTYIRQGTYAKFGLAAKGFFKLRFYADNRVETEVWVVDKENDNGRLVYQTVFK